MPELPEVETIRRGLVKTILNKKIVDLEVKKPKLIRNNLKRFKKVLINNEFVDINRRAKLLIFKLKKGKEVLLIHLKMTGQLIYQKKRQLVVGGHNQPAMTKELPGPYSHIILSFEDDSTLYFNDMRQFGYWQLVGEKEVEKIEQSYGLEPLTVPFNLKNFQKTLQGRKTTVKGIFLNQSLIAGIGNIYADEICFAAGVRPDRKVNSLSKKEVEKLYKAANKVIELAVKKQGTTFSSYRNASGQRGYMMDYLKVYRREGQPCLKCKHKIKKIKKVAGRGTRYCPHCQK